MFIRSSDHNYSLHTKSVFRQDWLKAFWTAVACSVFPFMTHGKQSGECTWRRMSLSLRNLYKCKQVVCCYLCVLFMYLCICVLLCYSCTVVVACLFVCSLFCTDVIILLFISWSRKQVNCFVFRAFIWYFNNTISTYVTITFSIIANSWYSYSCFTAAFVWNVVWKN